VDPNYDLSTGESNKWLSVLVTWHVYCWTAIFFFLINNRIVFDHSIADDSGKILFSVASGFLRQTGPSPANNYLLCLPCLQKQENNFFLKSKF